MIDDEAIDPILRNDSDLTVDIEIYKSIPHSRRFKIKLEIG